MARTFPLQSLQELSTLRLDTATRRLGELIAGEQEATRRHQLLVEYRAEYQARFVSAAQNGLGPNEWRNFQSFLAKLDEAIGQAHLMVTQSQARTAHGQREWIAKRGDLKAFETLAERHQQREILREGRQDQRNLDEMSARRLRDAGEVEE
jgi:flagellar FliJ protein